VYKRQVLFIAGMNYFAVDVPVDSSDDPNEQPDGEEQTQKAAPPGLLLAFILYIVAIVAYGFVKNRRTRREIMTKLYEERARDRGEEVDPVRLQRFLSHHSLDINRAHGCWSFCYNHDYDFVDESTGLIEAREEQEEEQEQEQEVESAAGDRSACSREGEAQNQNNQLEPKGGGRSGGEKER